MALLDIRQRVGWLFMTVTVMHLILISAQVQTRRGVPMLEEAIFGTMAEVQAFYAPAFRYSLGGGHLALNSAESDATRDIPSRYGHRHPGLAYSAMYPRITR